MANRIETGLQIKGLNTDTNALQVTGNSFINGDVNITGNVNVIGTATTLNTEIIQTRDNKILLNFSGTTLTAIGGGIEVLSARTDGTNVQFITDFNGDWNTNTGLNISGRTSDSTTNALKVINSSNNDILVVKNNELVGVGIGTPTAKLHINNTTSGNTFLAEDSTNPDSTPFVIDASGNTGIGTTTPTQKLQVVSSGTIGVTSLTGSSILIGSTSFGLGLDGNELANAGGDLFISTIDNNSIRFQTNKTEKVRITNNGDFGIGIANPTAKLHINNTTTGATFLAEDSTNPDSTPFVIDTDGNVGIGVSTVIPTSKLQVNFNGDERVILNQTSASSNYGIQYRFNGTRTWDIYSSGSVGASLSVFSQVLNSNLITLTSAGNIGIGITNPTERLNVSGNTKLDGNLTVTGDTNVQGLTATTLNGPYQSPYIQIGSSYTATSSNSTIEITGGTFPIQLPNTTVGFGRQLHIKNDGSGIVTVSGVTASQTIDSFTQRKLANRESLLLQSDGISNWIIINKNTPTIQFSHEWTIAGSAADLTTYYFGNFMAQDPSTTAGATRRVVALVSGWITDISLMVSVAGTLATSDNSTMIIRNVTTATNSTITSTLKHNVAAQLLQFSLSTPLQVTKGDELEMQWQTPNWGTNPQSVRHIAQALVN